MFALVPLFSFHLLNAYLFNIGIFPWFMIAATVLFFEPDTFSRLLQRFFYRPRRDNEAIHYKPRPVLTGCLLLFTAWQLLFPFRHFLYPGNVSWTEEGHRFSWHMKLRSKSAESFFVVKYPEEHRSWTIDLKDHLTSRQRSKMDTHPDMILQFAHYLEAHYRNEGMDTVEVYATVYARLNNRPPQLLIDPKVDLTAIETYSVPAPWIVPLTTPLHFAVEH